MEARDLTGVANFLMRGVLFLWVHVSCVYAMKRSGVVLENDANKRARFEEDVLPCEVVQKLLPALEENMLPGLLEVAISTSSIALVTCIQKRYGLKPASENFEKTGFGASSLSRVASPALKQVIDYISGVDKRHNKFFSNIFAEIGNLDLFRYTLSNGVMPTDCYASAFMKALKSQKISICSYLVQANLIDFKTKPYLLSAVIKADETELCQNILNMPSMHDVTKNETSSSHILNEAVNQNNLDLVKFMILEKHFNGCADNNSAFVSAIFWDSMEVLAFLLEQYPQDNVIYETLVTVAVQEKKMRAVMTLLPYLENPVFPTTEVCHIIRLADGSLSLITQHQLDQNPTLVSRKSDTRLFKNSLIEMAILYGDLDLFDFCLQHPVLGHDDNLSPQMVSTAIFKGDLDVVGRLMKISKFQDEEARNQCLSVAIKSNRTSMVRYILSDKYVNVSFKIGAILNIAIMMDNHEIFRLCATHKTMHPTRGKHLAIQGAIKFNDIQLLETFLDNSLYASSPDLNVALNSAINKMKPEILEFVLQHPLLNILNTEEFSFNCLSFFFTQPSFSKEAIQCLKVLLNDGRLDPSVRDLINKAFEIGNMEVIKMFVDDVRVDLKASNMASVKLGAASGNPQVIKYLCSLDKAHLEPIFNHIPASMNFQFIGDILFYLADATDAQIDEFISQFHNRLLRADEITSFHIDLLLTIAKLSGITKDSRFAEYLHKIQNYHIGVNHFLSIDNILIGLLEVCRTMNFDCESMRKIVEIYKRYTVDKSGSIFKNLYEPALILNIILDIIKQESQEVL